MVDLMDPEEIEAWDAQVSKLVKWSAYDFPEMDHEELYQNLWEWVMIQKATKPKLHPDGWGVTTAMQRAVKRGCWKQRAEQLHHSVQYLYRTTDVRHILSTMYSYDEWPEGWVPEDGESEDGMAPLDMRADITRILDRMKPPQYKDAILRRFRDGIEDDTGSSQRKRLNRAIERLTTLLNAHQPKPGEYAGGRYPMTNARAGWIIRSQEER